MSIRIGKQPPKAFRHVPYAAALLFFAGCGALLAAIPVVQDPADLRIIATR